MTVLAQPHAHVADAVLRQLRVRSDIGLSRAEAEGRRLHYGNNILRRRRRYTFASRIAEQFKSPLISILLAAGVLAFFLGARTDAAVIFIALAINTAVGIVQEGRAERAFDKLVASVRQYALVLREGRRVQIDAAQVVPGDILMLQGGDRVPADARLVEAKNLELNEATLTGEWVPSQKHTQRIGPKKRVSERGNMVWMGTLVSGGWGKAVVVATGRRTEFGKIAHLLEEERRQQTPLQHNIRSIARLIGGAVVAIVAGIFFAGILRGQSAAEMFLVAIAVAVAAVPEGLPIAVTVVLALGMERILRAGGLVRKLVAAETLGSASVIMVDKTGTLTQARMQISHIVTPAETYAYGETRAKDADGALERRRLFVLEVGMLASSAFIENPDAALEEWRVRGRPTDQALLLAGVHAGLRSDALLKRFPRLDTLPFDAERRFAASLCRISGKTTRVFVAGAPETVLEAATRVKEDGHSMPLSRRKRAQFQKTYEAITASGVRMIGVAFRNTAIVEFGRNVRRTFARLTFVGFVGFQDPIRKTVPDAVAVARAAGMRVIMVTGDHTATALAVAEKVGIVDKGFHGAGRVMDGEQLEKILPEHLRERTMHTRVFARILPHQKMTLVRLYQEQDEVVAMTGDGINDAPALHQADIGIALGSGTEVAKEASDLVLQNNSFQIIVRAIEQGRVIIDNLRRIVTYLLSTAFTEIILIGGSLALGFPLPLLPAQILWANIVQEGFMNFALAFEPGEDGVMRRKAERSSSGSFFTPSMKYLIFGVGLITDFFLFAIYIFMQQKGIPLARTRTFLFVGLSVSALFIAFPLKSVRLPLWRLNLYANPYLVAALVASLSLLVLAILLPPLRALLSLTTLSALEFFALLGIGVVNLAAVEAAKWLMIKKGIL